MSDKQGIFIECDPGKVSDGYHTFDELYDHRCALFLAFMKYAGIGCWKSRYHEDGTRIAGWFISGMDLPTGTITYHLPDRLWELCSAPICDRAPKWDGHTSTDVVRRLINLLERKFV